MIGSSAADSAAPALRRGLLWLAGLSVVGLAVELAAERHWTQPIQFVAWAALLVTLLAIGLTAGISSAGRLKLARWLAIAVMISAGFGIWEHIEENHDSGELDRVYGESWDSLPATTQWWLAASKTVGPSPPLAPGALAVAAFCVLLATNGHPAVRKPSEGSAS